MKSDTLYDALVRIWNETPYMENPTRTELADKIRGVIEEKLQEVVDEIRKNTLVRFTTKKTVKYHFIRLDDLDKILKRKFGEKLMNSPEGSSLSGLSSTTPKVPQDTDICETCGHSHKGTECQFISDNHICPCKKFEEKQLNLFRPKDD